MTPQKLKEILVLMKEFNVTFIKSGDTTIKCDANRVTAPTDPLKAKLNAMGSPPSVLAKFPHEPTVQYFKDTQSGIREDELAELGFAGIQPIQKKKAKVVKQEDNS